MLIRMQKQLDYLQMEEYQLFWDNLMLKIWDYMDKEQDV
jgi:hypothetical protein